MFCRNDGDSQISLYFSCSLLRDAYVIEEAASGSAKEVRCEQRWERKEQVLCLDGLTDGEIEGGSDRKRKFIFIGLSSSRESHLGKWPSSYRTHKYTHTATGGYKNRGKPCLDSVSMGKPPLEGYLQHCGPPRKTLLVDLNV